MLLYYVRHGEPIYNPDQLTPMGKRQAEAIGRRIARYGVDRIYSSTSIRAQETAQPLCEMTRKEKILLEWCHEHRAYEDTCVENGEGRRPWAIEVEKLRRLFVSEEMRRLGNRWYEHPELAPYNEQFKNGVERVAREADAFLKELGYIHNRKTGVYQVENPPCERVALFAHAGFGRMLISSILDWAYPDFATHVDMSHTGLTVIEFRDEGGWCIPRMLTFSNDGHLYGDNLPTLYNYRTYL